MSDTNLLIRTAFFFFTQFLQIRVHLPLLTQLLLDGRQKLLCHGSLTTKHYLLSVKYTTMDRTSNRGNPLNEDYKMNLAKYFDYSQVGPYDEHLSHRVGALLQIIFQLFLVLSDSLQTQTQLGYLWIRCGPIIFVSPPNISKHFKHKTANVKESQENLMMMISGFQQSPKTHLTDGLKPCCTITAWSHNTYFYCTTHS